MEEVLCAIIAQIQAQGECSSKELSSLLRAYNKKQKQPHPLSKRAVLEGYLEHKRLNDVWWQARGITPEVDRAVLKVLRMKPTRTASGVATITVITKPEVCRSNCLYCPSDVRMPKSYLFDEPACQRAEQHFFDPYLQVSIRLQMLQNMGHITDKVELIVLGGTWADYSKEYQQWFVRELFRALNDDYDTRRKTYTERMALYQSCGVSNNNEVLTEQTRAIQQEVSEQALSFNEAIYRLYKKNTAWRNVEAFQTATLADVQAEHKKNEGAESRCVGLVVETQPDTITPSFCAHIRALGCTKIQMGVQSLSEAVLKANKREISLKQIQNAFVWARLYGFKIHAHFMANLYGSDLERDKAEYRTFVTSKEYLPDEIKLYPCALIKGTALQKKFEAGLWRPYTQDELMELLLADVVVTPAYVRISRMIREFASHNIVKGNKKVNFRELVEAKAKEQKLSIKEIRQREISLKGVDVHELQLEELWYETAVTTECFLQWKSPAGAIAGFLRLSLPKREFVERHQRDLPISVGDTMIREVHVYGSVASLGNTSQGAQHLGLGKKLVERAQELAKDKGYERMRVISAVGTKAYYRQLGFSDDGVYQIIVL